MNKAKIILVLFLLINPVFRIFSQAMPDSYFEASYGKLEYGLFVPENYDTTKSYPLVMYLHGWGNIYSTYLKWYSSDIQSKNPCFVFSPKTPTIWADWSGWNDYNLSEPMTSSLHVLDSLIGIYAIDTNRLYVYGISMGGEGVFDLLHKKPGRFAAAMSVCGGGQENWAENIAKTPFWMFHGSADDVNPPTLTERVYKRLVEIGAKKMRYTSYAGYGHNIWDKAASEPSWYDWMFSFNKTDAPCQNPNKIIWLAGSMKNQLELSWNDISVPNEKANKIWYYTIFNRYRSIATTAFDKTNYLYTPVNQTDTFKVMAVNYCFENSDASNPIILQNNIVLEVLENVISPSLAVYTKKDRIIIENIKSIDDTLISIELLSPDGKLIFKKDYHNSDRISIDISQFNVGHFVVVVKYKNQVFTKKIVKM